MPDSNLPNRKQKVLTPRQKLALIRQVEEGRFSVSEACRKTGISRKTFYQWQKRYSAAKEEGKKPLEALSPKKKAFTKKHPRASSECLVRQVLEIAKKHPSYSSARVAEHVSLSEKGVRGILKRAGIPRIPERKRFKKERFPRDRLEAINLVEKGALNVTQACRRYGISRKTFYKWWKRHQIAKEEEKKALEAFSPKKKAYLQGHPRRSPNLFASEILEVIKRNPSLSTRGIAEHVCLSTTGVWGVLKRIGLATQKERKRFQRLYLSLRPWLAAIFTIEYLLGSLVTPEIPLISPLLAVIPKKRRAVALYLPLLILTFLGFFKLNQVLFISERTLFGRIGLVCSEIALVFGMFFFLYSLKYYLTLTLVLLFSRGANGRNNHGVLNGLRNGLNGINGFNGLNGLNGLRNGLRNGLNNRFNGRLNGLNGRLNGRLNGILNGRFGGLLKKLNGKINGRLNGLNGKLNGRINGLLNGRFRRLNGRLNGLNGLRNGLRRINGLNNHLNGLRNGLNGINGLNGLNGRFNGLNGPPGADLNQIEIKEKPFVSIHLPFYNERRVAGRILEACSRLNYENFSVLVLDDSNDGTTQIVEEWTKKDPRIKLVHRPNREGWKGGALKYALERMDPRAQYVIVFDADFIPFPDTIDWFLRYFHHLAGGLRNVAKSRIAAVQGYQWHVLNKDENWITRGIRGEYAGSYIIERSGTELFNSLKQIAGSVYMIRADLLRQFGWGTSITEDFQLTLRLYEKGYKVIYTPYIQAPAECVSTLKRLIRQRMRWAEGHTHNVRKMFSRLWYSPHLNLTEKLEFLYLSPYYLQSLFFLIGTIAWLAAEIIFRAKLPFWTATWGWALVFTNMFSLILMNAVGLFIEESDRGDYKGLLSFLATTYLVVPFQAYAAIKGLLERQEGDWFRTPKTGLITIELVRGHFARLFGWLFPRKAGERARRRLATAGTLRFSGNPHLALATANNRFNNFGIKRRQGRGIGRIVMTFLLIISTNIIYFSYFIPIDPTPNQAPPGSIIKGKREGLLPSSIDNKEIKTRKGSILDLIAPPAYAAEESGEELEEVEETHSLLEKVLALFSTLGEIRHLLAEGSVDRALKSQEPGQEILERRTQSSKTYDLGDGKYAWEGTIGPIHYKDDPGDSDELWKDIDTTINSAPAKDYEFKNETNTFKSYFKKTSKEENLVKYQTGKSFLTYTLRDNELGELHVVEGYPQDNQFVYPEAYDEIDIRFSIYSTRLLEELVLKQYRSIEEISQEIYFEGAYFEKQEDGSIVFYDQETDQELWTIPRPVMYEEGNRGEESLDIHYEITPLGHDTYLITKVLGEEGRAWLDNEARVYPLVIDITVDKRVGASGDDGFVMVEASYLDLTSTSTGHGEDAGGNTLHSFHRFTGVTIEGTINVSYTEHYRYATSGSPQMKFRGVDEDDPDAPTTYAEFSADPLTTAGIDWDVSFSSGWNQSPSLNSIFQELVDTYTISNEAVMIQLRDDGSATNNYNLSRSWNYTGNEHGVKLHIEYAAEVDTATSANTTAYSFQRKTWFDGDRLWSAFHSDGDNRIEFWYSSDLGATWTENASAQISVDTNDFTIEADSSNAFITYTNGFDVEVLKAKTTAPNAYPGTDFQWVTPATVVYDGSSDTDKYSYPSMSKDSNNKVWITARHYETGTVDKQVTGDADDAYSYNGTQYDGRDYVYLGVADAYETLSGTRFQDVTVPQGATIEDNSYWSVYPYPDYENPIDINIHADDVDDSGVIEGGTALHNRTLTSAYVNWAITPTGGQYNNSPGIKTVIQAIVNREGWASGNSLTIISDDQQSSYTSLAYDYQGDSTKIAKLHIEWSNHKFQAIQSTNANDVSDWQTATTLDQSGNSNKYGTIVPLSDGEMYAVWIDGTTIEGKKYTIVDKQVGASSDDVQCYRNNGTHTFEKTYAAFNAGYFLSSAQKMGAAARFTNVGVPQGSTITAAYLSVYCIVSRSTTTVNSRLYADAADNSTQIADDADLHGRTPTTKVDWDNIPAWTSGSWYDSVSIVTPVQEVVNRAGWVSGNAMNIYWEDFEGRSTAVNYTIRQGRSYDGGATQAPKLHIEYWPASATTIAASVTGLTKNMSAVSSTQSSVDYVHLIYDDGSSHVIYDQWDSSNGNWTAFTNQTLDSAGTCEYLTLSKNTANNDLYAIWIRGDDIYYSTDSSPYTSWSSATAWQTNGTNKWVTSNYSGNEMIFAQWTEGTGSPYSIMWDSVLMNFIWDGSSSTDWFTGANWIPNNVPGDTDDVIIDGNYTNAPTINAADTIGSLKIGENNTSILTFSNNITLTVGGNVTVYANGTITHTANTTVETHKLTIVVGGNMTIDNGGKINTNEKGYNAQTGPGYSSQYCSAYGPGSGASYGGWGGCNTTNGTYGSITAPNNIGSGGRNGYAGEAGRKGGGAIKLDITGTLTINGTISAEGQDSAGGGNCGGGGSGGSIWIIAGSLAGTLGSITANGGGNAVSGDCGGGGGGRIAITGYTSDNFSGTKSAYGGEMSTTRDGGAGTIYTKSSSQTNGDVLIDNNNLGGPDRDTLTASSYTFDAITCQKTGKARTSASTTLTVTTLTAQTSGIFTSQATSTATTLTGDSTGSVVITSGGSLTISNTTLSNPPVTNNGTFTANGASFNLQTNFIQNGTVNFPDDDLTIGNGGTLEIKNTNLTLDNLTIQSGGVLTHTDNSITETYKIFLTINQDMIISSTGKVNVNERGYDDENGPGNSSQRCGGEAGPGSGASYGGWGGCNTTNGPYGSEDAPVDIGSGGRNGYAGSAGGDGAGAVRIDVTDTLTISGEITANGQDVPGSGNTGGGGSGGSVYLNVGTLDGCGTISADGGDSGTGGGGGGGRIAYYYTTDNFSSCGTVTVDGGSGGTAGGSGTIIPENLWLLLVLAPFLPRVLRKRFRFAFA